MTRSRPLFDMWEVGTAAGAGFPALKCEHDHAARVRGDILGEYLPALGEILASALALGPGGGEEITNMCSGHDFQLGIQG